MRLPLGMAMEVWPKEGGKCNTSPTVLVTSYLFIYFTLAQKETIYENNDRARGGKRAGDVGRTRVDSSICSRVPPSIGPSAACRFRYIMGGGRCYVGLNPQLTR